MSAELLLLLWFKEKAIKAPRDSCLYCARKNKKVAMLKMICVYTYN